MSDKFQSILLGGAVAGLITAFLPVLHPFLGCLACVLLPVAGVLSVWHFVNNVGGPMPAGPGAGMGALAGIAAAVVSGLIGWALSSMGLTPDPQEFMRDFMERMGADPDQMADLETQQTPAMMAIGMVINVIVAALLGAVGGAIGASIFGKKEA